MTANVGAVDWLLRTVWFPANGQNFGNQTVPRWPDCLPVGVQAQFRQWKYSSGAPQTWKTAMYSRFADHDRPLLASAVLLSYNHQALAFEDLKFTNGNV